MSSRITKFFYQLTSNSSASGSMASSEAKNKRRSVGDADKIARQAHAEHADLVFMHNSCEVACVEIGLGDGGPNATKELQGRELKMPKMMKAFCLRLLKQYPSADKKSVKIVGFIIGGKAFDKSMNESFSAN